VKNPQTIERASPKGPGLPVDAKRAEFLVRADLARKMARYSGPIDSKMLAAATRALVAWRKLTETLIKRR
jgi:hypothetical protein